MEIDTLLNSAEFDAIALNEIDTVPGPCCMSFGFDLQPLVESIDEIGLINMPFLLRNGGQNDRLSVITGYKRILALRELRAEHVTCRILSGSAISPLDCLRINLYENITVRSLNPVEKGMVLNRLDPLVSQDEIRHRYMPLLGLPSHQETHRLYLRVDRDLDDATKHAIAQERLGIQCLKRLMDLDPDARSAISELFIKIKFNINQQMQAIDYLDDLSHIEHRSVTEILTDDALMEILRDDRTNTPQKAKAILHLLKERRLPSVAQADRAFKRQVAGLLLPKGVQIASPPYFEGSHFKMTILFKEGPELAKTINKLNTIEALKSLNFPWKETP